MPGNVVANLWTELGALCRELDERRKLADQLKEWFAANPSAEKSFGEWQAKK